MNAHKLLVDMKEAAIRNLAEALLNPDERIRNEAGKILDEIDIAWNSHGDSEIIDLLLRALGSHDGLVRVTARQTLVSIGKKAV